VKRRAILGTALAGLMAMSAVGPVVATETTYDRAGTTWFYGLTANDRLLTFSSSNPCDVDRSVRIRGLAPGESLIGIDIRPANGALYAVGERRDLARLYTIDPATGWATFVADLRSATTGEKIRLTGDRFGFDFNPTADALRIVSSAGQNLRVLPSDRLVMGVQRLTGDTFVDGTLSDAPITATPRPTVRGVAGAAYLNPDNDPATGTTLFDIDARRDLLAIQNPPNDGTLTAVGDLGRDVGRRLGFDIAADNSAWAAVRGHGRCGSSLLAQVDLATGDLDVVGAIGSRVRIVGLAAVLDPSTLGR
jgi:hypothetical protein